MTIFYSSVFMGDTLGYAEVTDKPLNLSGLNQRMFLFARKWSNEVTGLLHLAVVPSGSSQLKCLHHSVAF